MLCDTCRFSERPGFVRAGGGARDGAARDGGARDIGARDVGADGMIPCPDCGGQGIGHCCDGICEQPDLGAHNNPIATGERSPR
jgi:hypothetical protein